MIAQQQRSHANFKINPEKLEAEFQCTVCLNPINDCYITRCGHVYCRACIQETINRHHRCPFCNQELKEFKDDVFKNYHFNTIKKIVEEEIRKQNDKYLGKTFAQKIKVQQDIQGEDKLMAPIQKKILQMFEDTLLKYRKYMIEMYNLAKQTEEKKLLYGAKNIKTHDQVVNQLHSFILQNMPQPLISPELISHTTQLEIVLPNKKSHKTSIKLSPLAQFSSILPYMQTVCSQMNVRIQGQMPNQLLINGEKTHIDQRIGQLAGKNIKIQGIPIQVNVYCYTYNWDGTKATNFYHCKTCKTKWICENCGILCHKDHQVVIQLKDHKPDWACCYCVTKCNCKAINKSSKIKN